MALRLFNWAKDDDGYGHTSSTYNTMIYILGQAKEFDQVENLLKEMENNLCAKDIKTWTILVLLYGKAKLIGKALLVFEKMRKTGCEPEPDAAAYGLMIRSLCMARKPDIALEYYKEMVGKGFGINMNLYKLLFNCLSRSRDISAVHLASDDLIKLSNISAHDAYAHVLKSFCISGRIREALELIRELRTENISLDPEDFKTLLKGLCKANRTLDVLEILDIMEKKNVVDAKVYELSLMAPLQTAYGKCCSLNDETLENRVKIDTIAVTAMIAGHSTSYAMLANEMIISKNVFNMAISYLEKKGEKEKIKAVKRMQNTCGLNSCTETFFNEVADGPEPLLDLNSNNTVLPVRSGINLVESLPKSYSEHDLQQICGILSSSKTGL
ncbi:Pentatricopeptide repeat [Dillenia turbinata]|uniref:Pentatricopeptide repeat n=1 Tax=Dillenia turbinata TaxID=194707 RepID=A0AAN8ZLR0_9MAGN